MVNDNTTSYIIRIYIYIIFYLNHIFLRINYVISYIINSGRSIFEKIALYCDCEEFYVVGRTRLN